MSDNTPVTTTSTPATGTRPTTGWTGLPNAAGMNFTDFLRAFMAARSAGTATGGMGQQGRGIGPGGMPGLFRAAGGTWNRGNGGGATPPVVTPPAVPPVHTTPPATHPPVVPPTNHVPASSPVLDALQAIIRMGAPDFMGRR